MYNPNNNKTDDEILAEFDGWLDPKENSIRELMRRSKDCRLHIVKRFVDILWESFKK